MSLPETEEQKLQRALAKLHPSLAAIVGRLKDKSAPPTADEAKLVRDGKAEVHVWLTEKSPEVVEQLRQLGFEVVLEPKTAKMLVGRLPIDKLAALAQLEAVRYVAPQT